MVNTDTESEHRVDSRELESFVFDVLSEVGC
jgi:hypothetical protein